MYVHTHFKSQILLKLRSPVPTLQELQKSLAGREESATAATASRKRQKTRPSMTEVMGDRLINDGQP